MLCFLSHTSLTVWEAPVLPLQAYDYIMYPAAPPQPYMVTDSDLTNS